jgi:uncharacterized protein YdcH (DUF465 family)
MLSAPRDVRQLLLESDAELRKLERERCELDARLEQLGRSLYLSGEDRIRLATLKKLKLRIRDQIEELIARRWHEMPGRAAEGSPSHSDAE